MCLPAPARSFPLRPAPQNTFNIDLDNSSDGDTLLDLEGYSSAPRWRCCGRECALPAPPDWWFRQTKRQRRCLLAAGGCALTFTLLLLVLAAAAATKSGIARGAGGAAAQAVCSWDQWRLPPVAAPSRYNLTFEVQMQAPWAVLGSVGIDLNVTRPTACLVLHAVGMHISDVRLGSPAGPQARYRLDPDTEQLALIWDEALPVGPAAVFLTFGYALREGMSGFYRSTYTLQDGQRYSMAATQFEANSARAAFPCFDEPAFKARFNVEVITAAGLTVLSNMPARATHHVSCSSTRLPPNPAHSTPLRRDCCGPRLVWLRCSPACAVARRWGDGCSLRSAARAPG
jgi:hypothetical protein